jgi:dTDP-4-dehydrorhamnose 3,5-epimerase
MREHTEHVIPKQHKFPIAFASRRREVGTHCACGGCRMNVIETAITGMLIIEPKVFGDARGFFLEIFQEPRYRQHGIDGRFVQDNLSRSAQGVLRGLHIQNPKPQGKLVTVLRGAVLDVSVDVRRGSPTFGRHVAVELSEDNHRQVWIPRGLAHGFTVRSEGADFFYKCDELYSPADELVLRWDDPALGIDWGCASPRVSARDREGCTLAELADRLPSYEGP